MSNTNMPVNKLWVSPGERIGLLTVVKEVQAERWGTYVLCRCVCGKEVVRRLATIRSHSRSGASVPSCGCRGSSTYKAKGTRLYRIWSGMKTRCYNARAKDYPRYGGRGIRVCERWWTFEGFQRSMPPGYCETKSLDRIDPNKGYEPSNCRWADTVTQARNKRNSILHEGKPLKQVAEETGIAYSTLICRYEAGDRGERLVREVQKKRKA